MTMTARRYVLFLRRWIWLLILATVVSGTTAYLVSRTVVPTYQASTKLLVGQSSDLSGGDVYGAILGAERLAGTYADLVKTRPVLERAIKRAGVNTTPDGLAPLVSVQPIRNTQLLQLSVESTSPTAARDLANALGQALIEQRDEIQRSRVEAAREDLRQRLDQQAQDIAKRSRAIDAAQAQQRAPASPDTADAELARLQAEQSDAQQLYAALSRSYQELLLAEARSVSGLAVVDPAVLPQAPVKPNIPLQTAMGAAAGLVLGLAVAFLKELLSDAAPSSARVFGEMDLPMFAEVGGRDRDR
jgi:succinoglycan biosynthesis transport protein ExoP